ncbi:dihydrofolate reductase family protein [Tessaracoccus antarcticus]|uniref:Dihydrofolate reductase n=1 Tax=Tessaracoccus antarcticus TaxID=2479848 RepID=A0A3M0GX19_9ACTN|nr:dihydrofolate reductase family protein [Tessaracoccus antarcticus]RMB61916.1 dihydrofolate reductase [Tessaracoccus antarcticus]
MKLTVNTFVTLDGVMQGPGGAEEDPTGGFTQGGWLVPYVDEGFGQVVDQWFAAGDAVLLGRTTYDLMSAFWPLVTDPENATATALNDRQKYVVSHSLTDPGWQNTTVLTGDVVESVRALKEELGEGELQVHGSAQLAATLHEAGLVDEYRLLVFPVCVGPGKRLFREQAPPVGFEVVDSRSTEAGVTHLVLRPTAFRSGVVGIEDGRETV